MNFLSFEYFLAVARADSIRSAAAQLMISQQALSDQIRRLEGELGVKLLTDTRPARLTACGRRFAEYASDMLLEKQRIQRELLDISGQKREILVSIPTTDFPPFLPEVTARFAEKQPDCMVRIEVRPVGLTPAELKQYDFHIAERQLSTELEVLKIMAPQPETTMPFTKESASFGVLVAKELLRRCWGDTYELQVAELLRRRDLRLLRDVPFIQSAQHRRSKEVERLFAETGFVPKYAAGGGSSEICFALCCAGTGAFVAPEGWLLRSLGGSWDREKMLLIRLDRPFPPDELMICYEKGKVLSPQEQTFLSLVTEAF